MTITVHDLRFSYKTHDVLKGLSLQIVPGALVCLVGPNGSGKSTLLRCMDRILRPSHGDVIVDGTNIKKLRPRELARKICYVPQNCSQNFPLNVFEVVMMGRRPHLHFKVSEADRRVIRQVLLMLGLGGFERRYFDELSGGEKQKVLLARALAQEAPIMLLDEPTSNLDMHYQLEVLELLHNLKQTKRLTIIIAIHDLNMAARFADSLIMLNQGRIIAQGPPSRVLTNENIEQAYKIKARINSNGKGEVQIWPLCSVGKGYQAMGPTNSR